ncbi:hypothetical protein FVO59_01880 [Microbacterium esteraromaticum]|uniref:Uncharacterized protein n=1 Tax=Microbacterium esteraromaticum TaxID=57043 RepID=A0A7D8A8R1_9MICO|nr:hypothetical protein [Microbacterium esteraromaticum]QMU96081.1 hypothetical protein FVO59_01880 [Microbacterium esteraromaticum]
MSARIVLVLDASASALEYALVDVDRRRILADGRVDRIGSADAEASHTVHFFAEPGEPAPTVLSATAGEAVAVDGPDAVMRVVLDQFTRHGPSLDESRPIAVAQVGDEGGIRSASTTAFPGIPQHSAPGADSPLIAARRVLGLI